METIKVLEVIRQGQIGGGESHILDLIAGFDRKYIEPIVMAFTSGHMIDTLTAQGITCYVIETQKAFDIKVQKEIKEIIRKENIQLIHAHGSRAASNMLWTSLRLNLPMIYTVHGWSFHQDQPKPVQWARAMSEKLICKLSKQTICVSESNRQSGIKAFGLKNCTVIENGINLKRFDSNGTYSNIREELSIAQNDFIVGFIARITLQKNPLTFIKSIAIAHKENPQIKGLIIGEGDMEKDIKKYIKDNRLEKCIYTSPFRTDIPDILNAIDVYCLPSLWEGLSIALLEAMAMKKPIVVTPTDGTKEFIIHKKNGWIVDFNNPEELADSYIQYLKNPQWMHSHGEAARSIVKEKFNSQRVSDEVCDIYKNIALK